MIPITERVRRGSAIGVLMTTNIAIPNGTPPPAVVRSSTADVERKAEGPSPDPASHPGSASVTTTTISAAAQALAKEAAETPAQTAQEAQGNDRQAQRLIAQQAAARKAYS